MERLPGERAGRQEARKHKGNRGNKACRPVVIPLFRPLLSALSLLRPFILHLVMEQTHAGKRHRYAVLVAGLYHIVITH